MKNKELSETERLAKGLNRGMKFAGWLVMFVLLIAMGTCIFILTI